MQTKLAELLKRKEDATLDFKQTISSLDKAAKSICAFANTRGGTLLIGVKDDRSVVGIDPEEEKYMLQEAAEHFCEPPVALHFEEVEEEEQTVLIVEVPESPYKPHAFLNKGGKWQVYVRQADRCIPASKAILKQLEQQDDTEEQPSPANKQEKQVLDFIRQKERITVNELEKLLNYSRRRAQRLLIQMESRGLIRLFDHEGTAYYA